MQSAGISEVVENERIVELPLQGRQVTDLIVLSGAAVGPRVVAAYRRAEAQRREQLSEYLTVHGVAHAMIAGSADIRQELIAMTGVFARAG